jgi:hypothetical protein
VPLYSQVDVVEQSVLLMRSMRGDLQRYRQMHAAATATVHYAR